MKKDCAVIKPFYSRAGKISQFFVFFHKKTDEWTVKLEMKAHKALFSTVKQKENTYIYP